MGRLLRRRLMVLLSFFVIFFSFGKDETNSILQQIMKVDSAFKSVAGTSNSSKIGFSLANRSEIAAQKEKTRELLIDLKNMGFDLRVKKLVEGESLLLMLPDNAFSPGDVALKKDVHDLFVSTLKSLSRYKNEIEITFIGYSDTSALKRRKSRILQTNFDLSALRASHALETAVEMDFPLAQLKAKGQSHFGRETRTLSIQINLKEAS